MWLVQYTFKIINGIKTQFAQEKSVGHEPSFEAEYIEANFFAFN